MKVEANLINYDLIEIIRDNFHDFNFEIYVDDNVIFYNIMENDGHKMIIKVEEGKELIGHKVVLKTFNDEIYYLNMNKAVDFNGFDNLYTYEGNDLGPTYTKYETVFKLWAPLAYRVKLLINDHEYEMKRNSKGVFTEIVDGDLDKKEYLYRIYQNGEEIEVIDPYAKSGIANNKKSAVINLDKLDFDTCDESLPKINSYLDAIIYECNVRDMTIDPSTDISSKGKFLGLIEKNRHTKEGNPAGFDYISSLGITHLQLMPVLDFSTVDDLNTSKKYNWGYDPRHYFTLSGSYSLDPNDPYSRLIEFKKLVRSFHLSGIRVNLDVVFNHVYEAKTSIFQKIVPNYYFRRDENNEFMNHSYCGNELATERVMVRKMIIDSLVYLVKTFHVDGFRFDLMGLIDIDTIKIIYERLKEINPSIMLYGEGWNMFTSCYHHEELSTMENAHLLPQIAFFNDRYRNIVRGHGSKASLDEVGYFLGNESYVDGFKFIYLGSSFDVTFPKLFTNVNQSINYFECHDNATIYDVVKTSINSSNPLRIVKKLNKLLLLSFGIPFIHAGQEIGLTKFNHANTYNEGDKFNMFDYSLLDKRMDMAKAFNCYIEMHKEIKIFKCEDLDVIRNNVHIENDGLLVHVSLIDIDEKKTKYHIYLNPSEEGVRVNMPHPVDFFIPKKYRKDFEKHVINVIDISPLQVSIFYEI